MGNRVMRLYYYTISFCYSYSGSVHRVFFVAGASLTSHTLSSTCSAHSLGKHSATKSVGLAFLQCQQTTCEKAGSDDRCYAFYPLHSLQVIQYTLHTYVFDQKYGNLGLECTQGLKLLG